jgi:hypothetical protein
MMNLFNFAITSIDFNDASKSKLVNVENKALKNPACC